MGCLFPLLLFLLFLRAVLALAFRRAEQAVLLLCNKHLPAILAHVERVVRIREHEAEYQRDCQHQGMEIPNKVRGIVKQRNAVSRRVAAERVHGLAQQGALLLCVVHQQIVGIVEESASRDQEHPVLGLHCSGTGKGRYAHGGCTFGRGSFAGPDIADPLEN